MRKYIKLFLLSLGIVGFLASCQCKNCKKDSEVSVQVCLGDGTQTDYDQTISGLEFAGYTCQ